MAARAANEQTYAFEATHGVLIHETGNPEAPDAIHFKRVHGVERDSVSYKAVYRFETTDADVAARVRELDGYGITEVKE